ncbi:MAG: PmoA family protein [Verrucomicrobiae bacterium]|nr:PmoA family protein [Verrucomicrobiae bacterium]
MNACKLSLAALCLSSVWFPLQAADMATAVKLIPLADRVRVEIGGQLFTEYIYGDGASRPYCYPILATDGTPMTRNFPMKKVAGEDTDHPWHRSLWFEHSMVNGVDFWNEGKGDAGKSPSDKGRTVQAQFTTDPDGSIHTHDNWIAPGGKIICTDERTLRFRATTDARMIDYEVTLHAPANEPLLLGDNKDGTMALRLAQWMTMPHKHQGGGAGITGEGSNVLSRASSAGHIVNATGLRDGETWGKRADWCDYYSQLNGKTYGVAIFDHPENLRHPTYWMARDYGLFGANPFGKHDYEKLPDQPHAGDYTIPAGGTLTLRYRFYFHNGDEKAARIAEQYAAYAAGK